jgi:AraC-type DNA-binding domain-containing proteins
MLSAAEIGVPGVLHFGRYNYVSAHRGLPPHQHRDAMEICVLVRGRQIYEVAGERYVLTGGDVFVTFPGEVHSTGGAPEEKGVLYWLILKMPPAATPWLALASPHRRTLRRTLLNLPRRHFRGSWKLRSLLDSMTARLFGPRTPLNAIALQNELVAFLLELLRAATAEPRAGAARARPLTPVLSHITSHLGEPLPIAELASLAGLSIPRFKARFTEELGVPPGEYVLRAKVAEAERRLRETPQTITHIAFDLGFSSSQYFATVMKRYTGQTPGHLRAQRTTRHR